MLSPYACMAFTARALARHHGAVSMSRDHGDMRGFFLEMGTTSKDELRFVYIDTSEISLLMERQIQYRYVVPPLPMMMCPDTTVYTSMVLVYCCVFVCVYVASTCVHTCMQHAAVLYVML